MDDIFIGIKQLEPSHINSFSISALPSSCRRQQAGELLVALEQKLHALRVAGERGLAVAGIHGAVEGLMGFDQRGRHRERVVEVGEGC